MHVQTQEDWFYWDGEAKWTYAVKYVKAVQSSATAVVFIVYVHIVCFGGFLLLLILKEVSGVEYLFNSCETTLKKAVVYL